MADARQVLLSAIVNQVNYELRNTGKQFSSAEIVSYINRSLELVYQILCDDESPLVRTGTGTISVTAGTNEYSLPDNDMGDLWFCHRVWIAGSDPMDLADEEDRYEYKTAEDDGDTGGRDEPDKYYLTDNSIGLLPYPDGAYTVNIVYYPMFSPVETLEEDVMPFKNLFNQQVIEATKMFAKNRENSPLGIEAAMMEIFQTRARRISRKRENRPVAITVKR